MDPRIAVISPEGVGGPLGGLLTRAGHDVVLIDQWPAHVEAMKAHGLRITIGSRTDPEAEYVMPVRVYHPYEVCTLIPRCSSPLPFPSIPIPKGRRFQS
ncbi:2-dehydropantoate 2-reductase N-terminal domain-containing protein [Chloroflexota bacterium]